ncbi:DUF3626 domain-containing protein [Nakamurella lactea]|uniref:DUF3626 domain-containing protein n=1 Tax=Nakamurella lactea TaxID=459515 RepID=UPI0003F9D6B9|nr:DUF3626 domain-containing protein [Nakamurella lactea]
MSAEPSPPAVNHVRARAAARSGRDRDRIAAALTGAVLPEAGLSTESLADRLFQHPITINFHPDRVVRTGATAGLTVAESLLRTGGYLTQYQTGISAGGLTAHRGGDRHRWEVTLFGDDYAAITGSAPVHRPRYGGLNIAEYPDGSCPRFGSCVLVLRPHTVRRSTFSVGDSSSTPTDIGTSDAGLGVLAGLLETAHRSGRVLNLPRGNVAELIAAIRAGEPPTAGDSGRHRTDGPEPTPVRALGRALDDYVEAQVHGPIDLAADVAALVVDPSFDHTRDGTALEQVADRFQFPLLRHPGYGLPAGRVGPEFRGPAIPGLARRVQREFADGGPLTAAAVGRAAVDLVHNPHRWTDHDPATTAQHLKQLWHTLVAFGDPIGPVKSFN